jgi:hypothetical protein
MTDHNRRQKNPKQKNHTSKNRISETLLNPYSFCRQDILDPTNLFEHLIVYRVIDQEKGKCTTARPFTPQLHSGDVHTALAKDGSDFSNNARPVRIGEEDLVSTWNLLQFFDMYVLDSM